MEIVTRFARPLFGFFPSGGSVGVLSADPILLVAQGAIAAAAVVLIFLVFFTTRDILRRSRSLVLQGTCILLVALLPLVGFLLYVLLRPARTLAEKEMEEGIREALRLLKEQQEHIGALHSGFPIPGTQWMARKTDNGRRTDESVTKPELAASAA